MTTTLPLTSRRLAELAAARQTAILAPPKAAKRQPCGSLVLFPADTAHLVKGSAPRTLGATWWAVTWERTYADEWPGRLELVDPATWRLVDQGQPRTLEPSDMGFLVRGRPVPVLEALAVAVHHQLEITIWRMGAQPRAQPTTRDLGRPKIHADRRVVVAEDLDKQAPRAFRLGEIVGVEIRPGQPVPVWDGSCYALEPSR